MEYPHFNKSIKKAQSIVLKAIVCTGLLFSLAVSHPSINKHTVLHQPDGYSFNAVINGDEFYLHIETTDGYTVVKNDQGYWCYGKLNASGSLVAGKVVSRTVDSIDLPKPRHLRGRSVPGLSKRLQKHLRKQSQVSDPPLPILNDIWPYPHVTGDITGLVILIDFPDQQATIPAVQIDSFFNGGNYTTGGVNGSVNQFYKDVSSGKLNYHCLISPEYYRAKHDMSYYDASYSKTDQLFSDACAWLASKGMDLSKLSLNANGTIRALNFVYAGSDGTNALYGASNVNSFKIGSLSSYSYQYCGLGNSSALPLGILCHETGHFLMGWPDLYDYEDPPSYGIGDFGLMSYGMYGGNDIPINPTPPNPILRYYAGWTDLESLNGTARGTQKTITSNIYDSAFAYRNSAKAGEMFVMEAVQKKGRFAGIPGEGVIIWHADTSVTTENKYEDKTDARHYTISVEQADGKFDLENDVNAGDKADFFKAGGVDKFNDSNSTCNSHWWDGDASGFDVRNIGAPGQNVSFIFGTGTPVANLESGKINSKQLLLRVKDNSLIGLFPETYHHLNVGIYSLSGHMIERYQQNLMRGRVTIPLNSMSTGVYNVRINADGKIHSSQQIIYVK